MILHLGLYVVALEGIVSYNNCGLSNTSENGCKLLWGSKYRKSNCLVFYGLQL